MKDKSNNNSEKDIIIDELMKIICDIKNGAEIISFESESDNYSRKFHGKIILKERDYPKITILEQLLMHSPLKTKENEEFGCHNCEHHNYDWFDDGDEFEVCDKGHELHPNECADFKEL